MNDDTYGKRKDDLMLPDLTPEVVANLTDTQKMNIKIVQNITSLNTALNDVQHDVSLHQKLLVTGNGEPSLQERLRNVEHFVDGFKYWIRFIGGALVLQTLTFTIGIIVAIVRFLPVLEKLASTKP